MSSVLRVIFDERSSDDVIQDEIKKQQNVGAKLLDSFEDFTSKGYIIMIPDDIVRSIRLITDDVVAVVPEEAAPASIGKTLTWVRQ